MRTIADYTQVFKSWRMRDHNVRPDVPSPGLFLSGEERLDQLGGLVLAAVDSIGANDSASTAPMHSKAQEISKGRLHDLTDTIRGLVAKHGKMSVETLFERLKRAKPNAGITVRLVRELMSSSPLSDLRPRRGPKGKSR